MSLKLNLGSAIYKLPGWVNVDHEPSWNPDVVAEANELDWHFDDESADEIYAGHLMEHLWYPLDFLEQCLHILKPGGRCGIVVPDFAKAHSLNPNYPEAAFGLVWGSTEYPNSGGALYTGPPPIGHAFAYDSHGLRQIMEKAGFVNLQPIDLATDGRVINHNYPQCGWDGYRP